MRQIFCTLRISSAHDIPMSGADKSGRNSGVQVWDVPIRVFHWTLVVLLVSQVLTATIGGNAMQYHVLGGYTILTLVVFRIVWGIIGSHHALFQNFLRGPGSVHRYAVALINGKHERHIGHNPLGGWSVALMLLSLLVQTATGLFADDEIMTSGPLEKYVSDDTSSLMSAIHEINALVLAVLVTVHVAAVLYYLVRWKENLIVPMVTGRKLWHQSGSAGVTRSALLLRATIVLALSGLAVAVLVNI